MITIGNRQQISHETLLQLYLVNANILLHGDGLSTILQVNLLTAIFGFENTSLTPKEELREQQKLISRLINDISAA